MINLNIDQLEKKLVAWLIHHRRRIVLVAIMYMFTRSLLRVPYLNLLIEDHVASLIFIMSTLFVVKISGETMIMLTVLVLPLLLMFEVLGYHAQVIGYGNYVYALVAVAVIKISLLAHYNND